MRMIAYGLLTVILSSFLIVPMVELAIVYREKIVLDSAVRNASRVAKDRALEYEHMRNLDAVMDEERFKDYFAETFEDAMNMSRSSSAGNTLRFTSDDGKFLPFTITLDFFEEDDGRQVSKVTIRAEADYKFKTALMRTAERLNPNVNYELSTERTYILSVRN